MKNVQAEAQKLAGGTSTYQYTATIDGEVAFWAKPLASRAGTLQCGGE